MAVPHTARGRLSSYSEMTHAKLTYTSSSGNFHHAHRSEQYVRVRDGWSQYSNTPESSSQL